MRLWSLHPSLLDRQALVACWREGLLAQKVLAGGTKGYTRHPQLERFRDADEPLAAIVAFLHGIADEADARGYRFDRSRLLAGASAEPAARIPVTDGQLAFELEHLRAKVAERSPEWQPRLEAGLRGGAAHPHPLFIEVPGDVEAWERGAPRP